MDNEKEEFTDLDSRQLVQKKTAIKWIHAVQSQITKWSDDRYFRSAARGGAACEELLMLSMQEEGISESCSRLLVLLVSNIVSAGQDQKGMPSVESCVSLEDAELGHLQFAMAQGTSDYKSMVAKSRALKSQSHQARIEAFFSILSDNGEHVTTQNMMEFIAFIFPNKDPAYHEVIGHSLFLTGSWAKCDLPEFTALMLQVTRRCDLVSKFMKALALPLEVSPGPDTDPKNDRSYAEISRAAIDRLTLKFLIKLHRYGKLMFEILSRGGATVTQEGFDLLYSITMGKTQTRVLSALIEMFQAVPDYDAVGHPREAQTQFKYFMLMLMPYKNFTFKGELTDHLTQSQFNALAKFILPSTGVSGLFETIERGNGVVTQSDLMRWADPNLMSFADSLNKLFEAPLPNDRQRSSKISLLLLFTVLSTWLWCIALRVAVGVLTPMILQHFTITLEEMSLYQVANSLLQPTVVFVTLPLLQTLGTRKCTFLISLLLLVLYVCMAVSSVQRNATLFLLCWVAHGFLGTIACATIYPLLTYVFEGDPNATHYPIILQISYSLAYSLGFPLAAVGTQSNWVAFVIMVAALQFGTVVLQIIREVMLARYPSEGSEHHLGEESIFSSLREEIRKCKPNGSYWIRMLKNDIPVRVFPLLVFRFLRSFAVEAIAVYGTYTFVVHRGMDEITAGSISLGVFAVGAAVAAFTLAPVVAFTGRFSFYLAATSIVFPLMLLSIVFPLNQQAYIAIFTLAGIADGTAEICLMPGMSLGTSKNGMKLLGPLHQSLRGLGALIVPIVWQRVQMSNGFDLAWLVCAGMSSVGIIMAWLAIYLDRSKCDGKLSRKPKPRFFTFLLGS